MRLVTATLAAAALGLLLFVRTAAAPRQASPHAGTVVLELFTSQGCSSCPPADALLSRLRHEHFNGQVIPLAFHVDYWNHLGWRDPFSSSQWSARQQAYARAIRGSQLYTPQAVLDGSTQFVGSSEGAIRGEIKRQLAAGDDGTIDLEDLTIDSNAVHGRVRGNLVGGRRAKLVVVLFENGVITNVAAGENAHRKLTNDGIVRWFSSVGEVRPGAASPAIDLEIPLDPSWKRDRLGVAAFLQDPQTLSIHGAAAEPVAAR